MQRMKTAIFLLLLVLATYLGSVFAVKLLKPDFVCHNDGFTAWYAAYSYPVRYSLASMHSYPYWRDGRYVFNGANASYEKIFLDPASGGTGIVIYTRGDQSSRFAKAATGQRFDIRFGHELHEDAIDFSDRFAFFIVSMEPVPAQP